jgi:hypothetical protein
LYADEITDTNASDSIEKLIATLTADLAAISKWLYHNHLVLNISKTNAMDFAASNRGRKPTPAGALLLDGKAIGYVDQVTLLGVTFNRFLDFDQHTVNICKKVNVKLHILLRCAHLFHVNFKSILYKIFLQSHFDYCSTVYSHLSATSTKRLNNCSRRALFKLLKINTKGMDINQQFAALAVFNILPLPLRRLFRFGTYLFTICKRKTSPLYDHIYKHKSNRGNDDISTFIHPRCRINLLLYSFSYVSIKLLNLFLDFTDKDFSSLLQYSKTNFYLFLKTNILVLYNDSSQFFKYFNLILSLYGTVTYALFSDFDFGYLVYILMLIT